MGDLPRIRGLFGAALWTGVTLEEWRKDHAPLPLLRPRPRKVKE